MAQEKQVFISHSSADDIISEKVYQYLENLGVGCWMDKHDIVPGIPYARAIMKGLDMCKAMLVLLSANSIKSDDVLNEIDQAHSENKMLFPMFIENIELPRDFKYYLARRQWIVAYDNLDKGLNELSKAIETNLNIKLVDKEAEEREKKIKEAKKDLIRLAEEYHSLGIEQSKLSHKIEDKMRFAGITHRTCLVCESSVNLDSSFCPTCGWSISPIYGIEGAEYLLTDKNVQIDLMKSVWNKAGDSSYKEMVENLKAVDTSQKKPQVSEKEINKLVFSCCNGLGIFYSLNNSLAKSGLDCEKLSTSLNKKYNIALSVAEIKSCATLNAVINKILS